MSDGIMLAAESREELSDDDLARARLAVCAHAQSSEEAEMFLSMLGLLP